MKLIKPILVGSVFLTAIAFAGDANADFKKFMLAELPRVANAFNTKSIAYLDGVTTADFSEIDEGKTYNKAQSLSQMKDFYTMAKTVKATMKLLSSSVSGNTGTAMTSGHVVSSVKMDPKAKKYSTMVMDMWLKETWVRSGKSWKLKKLETAKPAKMTVDGKPFNSSKGG